MWWARRFPLYCVIFSPARCVGRIFTRRFYERRGMYYSRYTLRTYIYIYKYVYMHTTAYNTIIIIKGPADIWTDPKEWTTIPTRRGAAVGWVGLQRCVYIFFFQKTHTSTFILLHTPAHTLRWWILCLVLSCAIAARPRVHECVCVCVFLCPFSTPPPRETHTYINIHAHFTL